VMELPVPQPGPDEVLVPVAKVAVERDPEVVPPPGP
jgi:hypothetical protein